MAIKLQALKRDDLSSSRTKALRNEGKVPSVVYGKEKETKTVAVDQIELLKTVRDEGRNAIITLEIDDNSSVEVMLHEYQTDVIKGDVIHADFYIVDMTEEMEVSVPVRIEGDAAGVKDGGVLQQPLYEIAINVKPRDIPEYIEIDVSALEIGDGIAIGDLPASDNYTYLEEEETVVVSVIPPISEEELEASEEPVDAEPEVIGEKDEEEEE